MPNTPKRSSETRPVLKRSHVEAMLVYLSERVGAPLRLDEENSFAFRVLKTVKRL